MEGTALIFFYDGNGFQILKCRVHVLECEVGMQKSRECIWRLRALAQTVLSSFILLFPRLSVTVGEPHTYVHFIYTYIHIHIRT